MATFIKIGITAEKTQAADAKVRQTVETIISDVCQRGDAAVRALSERLDKWSPTSFCLSQEDIEGLIANLPEQTLSDIRFAQAQIRKFAEAQRSALCDIQV